MTSEGERQTKNIILQKNIKKKKKHEKCLKKESRRGGSLV